MVAVHEHDVRALDGGTIYLPSNPSIINWSKPNLHETSTTQLYPLGTRYVFNGKVFVYCKANTGGGLSPQHGAKNQNAISDGISYTTLSYPDADAATVAAAVDATSVYVVDAGATKDEYKGAHVILGHNSATTVQNRGVVGNDAPATIAGVANVVKIDLDFPLHTALVAGTSAIELMKGIYSSVARGDGTGATAEGVRAVVCVPCIYVATTAGEYFWGQTWGPCWLTPGADFGGGTHERMAVFDGYGSVQDFVVLNHTGGQGYQLAGFLLDNNEAPEDTSLIMLQISP